ncbi:MAG: hypothetical protein ACRCW0_05150 [Clostridium sp.]
MICEKCKSETPDDSNFCAVCGLEILNEIQCDLKKERREEEIKLNNKKASKNHQIIWNILSGVMFVVSGIMIYIGYDRLTNYYNSETLSSLNKNSYVGGDAYNYIINGNHATAFFVLATMFAIIAIGFIIIGYLDKISNTK